MTKQLPEIPNLEFLHKEAKDVHRAHLAGDVSVCTTLRHHPKLTSKSYDEILESTVSLQEIQHALALEYGFTNWSELCNQVERTNQVRSSDEDHPGLVEIGPGNWVYKDKDRDRLFYCPNCLQRDVPVLVLKANVTKRKDGDTLTMECPRCEVIWRGDNPRKFGFGTPLSNEKVRVKSTEP